MKASLKNFTKRLACVLSACVVATYSLFFYPIFSFADYSSDEITYFFDTAKTLITSGAPSSVSLPVTLGYDFVKFLLGHPMSTGGDGYSISSSTISLCGSAYLDGNLVSVITIPSDAASFVSTSDGIHNPVLDIGGTPLYIGFVGPTSSNNGSRNSMTFAVSGLNTSTSALSASLIVKPSYYGALASYNICCGFSSEYFAVLSRQTDGSNSRAFTFRFSSEIPSYSTSDIDTWCSRTVSGSTYSFYFGGNATSIGGVGSNATYTIPLGTISRSTIIDYLNNDLVPYYREIYPDYVDYLVAPDDLQEETTEPTATGAVIIIDPFTLPPEWVESDVVELDTESYTIDYDTYIDEPLENIDYPLLPGNPLHGGANILAYGIQFLKDGGIYYILCSVLLIGIFIRFLGI